MQYRTIIIRRPRAYMYNNNNNNKDDIYSAVIMTTGHCESSFGSFDELQNSAKRPSTLRPT